MKRYMQFRREPARHPVVLSVEVVSYVLAAVPVPGLKFRAALGIRYGARLRAAEVCNLRLVYIDSAAPIGTLLRNTLPGSGMIIHVGHGKKA